MPSEEWDRLVPLEPGSEYTLGPLFCIPHKVDVVDAFSQLIDCFTKGGNIQKNYPAAYKPFSRS